jgi:hypothetical protein
MAEIKVFLVTCFYKGLYGILEIILLNKFREIFNIIII